MDIVYRFDPLQPLVHHQVRTNEQALERLSQGNCRFAELVERMHQINDGAQAPPPFIVPINPVKLGVPVLSGLEPAHAPFALVLGCADARVPIEHVFDCSANDLFVVRVAGNVLGLECLGSVDYAACNLNASLRSVIVLGHTGCGAVTAAVDIYNSPADFGDIAFSHAVRSLLDRIMLAVRGSARALNRHLGPQAQQMPEYREWLITTAVYMNAAVTAWDLQREVNAVTTQPLPVSFGVYDMGKMRVSSLPLLCRADVDATSAFAAAPSSSQDFVEIAERIASRLIGDRSSVRI